MLSAEKALILVLNDHFTCRKVYTSDYSATDRCIIPQKLLREAMKYNRGAKIIIVHSHLGGDPTPSVDDINTTTDIKGIAYEHRCELFEHFVIAIKNGEYIYDAILRPKTEYENDSFIAVQKRIDRIFSASEDVE
jgi:DNA repair protein RadC